MAKGKFTGGKLFDGTMAGPGRPKSTPEQRALRQLTKTQFEKLCNKFVHMNRDEIVVSLQSPETTALELMVGKVIHEAIVRGDTVRFNFILERLIGKVKEQIEHSGTDGQLLKLIIEDYRTK